MYQTRKLKFNKLSGLVYIPKCRSPGQFVTRGSRLYNQFVTSGSMAVQYIIDFSLFGLEGQPLGQSSPSSAEAWSRRLSPSCKISARSQKRSTRCALPKFFTLLVLGAKHWADKVHQNGRLPATHPGLPSCQVSSRCVNPRRRYPLQKNLWTNKDSYKQTVNDISPACLSACGIKISRTALNVKDQGQIFPIFCI